MPLIPALGRQRQEDLCEFEASLVYKASSRTARTVTQRNPVSKQTNTIIITTKQKRKTKQKTFKQSKKKTTTKPSIPSSRCNYRFEI